MQQGYLTHLLIVLLVGAACAWLLAHFVSAVLAAVLVIVVVIYVVAVALDGLKPPAR